MKIKMILISMNLFLFGIGVTNAQVKDQTSIGPRVGVNFSNVSNVTNSKTLTGLTFGLTTTFSLNESSGITVDLLYSPEGYKSSATEFRQNYFQIPIFFDLFMGKLGESLRPKVYVGVVPGFLLNAKVNGTEVSKDPYNSFNLALGGGLGFNYRLAKKIWLNTDLRATMGLSDLRKENPNNEKTIAGRTYQLSLGLAYGLAKLD